MYYYKRLCSPFFGPFCAPGLVNQLGTSFVFAICFLNDSSPHLPSHLDVHGDNIAFNAHQCPPMPTNAHPMPIKIALQCPSNALNDVIPYRSCFVRGSSHCAHPGLGEGGETGREGRRGEMEGRARAGREGGGRGGERGKRAGEGTPANLHRVRRNGAGDTCRGRKLTSSPHCIVGNPYTANKHTELIRFRMCVGRVVGLFLTY